MEKHKYCPDENGECQHGDDTHCPALIVPPETMELAHKIVSVHLRGRAKDRKRGYHRLDGALMTDEVKLAYALIRAYSLL